MISLKKISIITLFIVSYILPIGAQAVPVGWKNDNLRNNNKYNSVKNRYEEMTLFKKENNDDTISYVLFGKFLKNPEETYKTQDILDLYFAELIPCYSYDSIKQDASERYSIECDQISAEDNNIKMHYVGLYKDITYAGIIVIGENVVYQDLRDLGFDPNVLKEHKAKKNENGAKNDSKIFGDK